MSFIRTIKAFLAPEESGSVTVLPVSTTARQAVANGAALLTARSPGWEHNITRPVDLTSSRWCVLGQVYGDFWSSCNMIWAEQPTELIDYAVKAYGFEGEDAETRRELQVEWTRYIMEATSPQRVLIST